MVSPGSLMNWVKITMTLKVVLLLITQSIMLRKILVLGLIKILMKTFNV